MHVSLLASLVVIAAVWGWGWSVGLRWCRRCGVHEWVSRWALASILPAALLVFAIHLLGFVTLFAPCAIVRPEPVAAIYLLLIAFAHHRTRTTFEAPCDLTLQTTGSIAPIKLGYWWFPVLVTVGTYGVFVIETLGRFPTGYDGLNYHLPLAVEWMRSQRLDLVPGMLYPSLPENGLMVPFLLSFMVWEKLIAICQFPNALLVAAAMYGLTRALGVSRRGCILSVCVAMSIPMVMFQSVSSYIDLYGAACWLCALLAITWAARVRGRGRCELLALAGLAAGLALGTKSTYLLLVALLAPIVMAVDWLRPTHPSRGMAGTPSHVHLRMTGSLKNLLLFGGFALVCSSFWFVRGTVQAGNPVYPFQVKIAGRTILPGFNAADHVPEHTWAGKFHRWWDYPWRETNYSGTGYPYAVSNALGAPYATFVPIGLAAALFFWIIRRPRHRVGKWRLVYLLLTLSGGLVFLTAFTEVLRYILPVILISVTIAAVLVDRLARRVPRSTAVVLTMALIVTAAAATIQPIRSFAGQWRDHRWDRAWFYQLPPVLDDLEPGARIVNLGDPPLTYPLLGKDYANVVIPLTRWRHLTGSGRATAESLYEHGIDYIWARQPWREGWTDGLPLIKIFDDTETRALSTTRATRVYRVVQPQTATGGSEPDPAERGGNLRSAIARPRTSTE